MVFQIFLYSLVTGTQVLLLALALYLVYAVSKVSHIALGAIAASAAYAVYFAQGVGMPLWGTISISLLTVLVLGVGSFFLNESFTKKQEYLLALLTSFAFGLGLEALLSILFGTDGKNLTSGSLSIVSLGAYQIPLPGLLILGFGVIVAFLSVFFLRYTPGGRTLRTIAESSFSATSLGIDPKKIRLSAYLIASLVVGVVGVLAGFNTALTPTMGFNLIIMAFMAFLVGGVSDVRGTIVASYLIALIPEMIIGLVDGVSSNWRMALVFIIASLLLLLKPEGLFADLKRKS